MVLRLKHGLRSHYGMFFIFRRSVLGIGLIEDIDKAINNIMQTRLTFQNFI